MAARDEKHARELNDRRRPSDDAVQAARVPREQVVDFLKDKSVVVMGLGVFGGGVDTAKFAAQYFPGMNMEQAGAAAGTAIGQYRAGDLAPLYKAGILNEAAINAAALPPSQFGMTGVPGTFRTGATYAGWTY